MKIQEKRKFYWRKLDDQAKVFALASNNNYSSIFRLSVILKEKIDAETLQNALELALEKYKAFKVKMKRGLFWYYFEENEKKPIISNTGKFEIENKYSKYVEKFFVILAPDWAEKIKCGICSYEENIVVTFGTILNDNLIESRFKDLLKENNINFKVEGNEVNVISN